ncbi:hypothetical protein P744_0108835 [Enterococcus faecium UC10237]|uniref:hypothetical protein n=1 Tax=Enterococcus faecium TaxID=1352 RepID=UPI0002A43B8B|nr:hypothetical protein [Enterococcus faecium]ELB12492.1 hypothetical protein OIM_03107 [Enterococcus faecium EnGen0032]KEI56832.1 hypothetical protein P744_0108835 [Enterococcus faecium UC10237]MCD4921336.1 hypothetical protein [Enterococcus faecium]MCD5025504.1 hypothetical protein [Enterococcus faecium]UQQ74293.1 hypothetical protein LQ068_05795 [Enterococcus faecium]
MPNQKTWTGKVGDTKTFTISAVPADAVVAATTATSSDGAIATVTKNENGGFDGTIAAEGSATFAFTSGEFTTSINVTGQPAS